MIFALCLSGLASPPLTARSSLLGGGEQIESMTLALAQEAKASREAGNLFAARAAAEQIEYLATGDLDPGGVEYIEKLQKSGKLLHELGFPYSATYLFRSAYERLSAKLGETHPFTMSSISSLAASLTALGEIDEAVKLNQTALLNSKRILGSTHPATVTSMANLASAYAAAGDDERAGKLFSTALELREQALGDSHPDTRRSILHLADYHQTQEQWKEAEVLYRQLLKILNMTDGPFGVETLHCLHKLGDNQLALGHFEKAESFYLHAWNRRSETLGPNDPDTIASKSGLASSLEKQGLKREAAKLMGLAYDEASDSASIEPAT